MARAFHRKILLLVFKPDNGLMEHRDLLRNTCIPDC